MPFSMHLTVCKQLLYPNYTRCEHPTACHTWVIWSLFMCSASSISTVDIHRTELFLPALLHPQTSGQALVSATGRFNNTQQQHLHTRKSLSFQPLASPISPFRSQYKHSFDTSCCHLKPLPGPQEASGGFRSSYPGACILASLLPLS